MDEEISVQVQGALSGETLATVRALISDTPRQLKQLILSALNESTMQLWRIDIMFRNKFLDEFAQLGEQGLINASVVELVRRNSMPAPQLCNPSYDGVKEQRLRHASKAPPRLRSRVTEIDAHLEPPHTPRKIFEDGFVSDDELDEDTLHLHVLLLGNSSTGGDKGITTPAGGQGCEWLEELTEVREMPQKCTSIDARRNRRAVKFNRKFRSPCPGQGSIRGTSCSEGMRARRRVPGGRANEAVREDDCVSAPMNNWQWLQEMSA